MTMILQTIPGQCHPHGNTWLLQGRYTSGYPASSQVQSVH